MHQPAHLAQNLDEAGGRLIVKARRNVGGRELHLPGGGHLADARQRQQDEAIGRLPLEQQAHIELAEPDFRRLAVRRAGVAQGLVEIAEATDGGARLHDGGRVAGASGQSEENAGLRKVLRHAARHRRWHLAGNVDHRAVGKHRLAACEGKLAELEKLLIERHRPQAPPIGRKAAHACFHEMFQPPVVLLEMLWLDEHAFGPKGFARHRHAAMDSDARNGWGRRLTGRTSPCRGWR